MNSKVSFDRKRMAHCYWTMTIIKRYKLFLDRESSSNIFTCGCVIIEVGKNIIPIRVRKKIKLTYFIQEFYLFYPRIYLFYSRKNRRIFPSEMNSKYINSMWLNIWEILRIYLCRYRSKHLKTKVLFIYFPWYLIDFCVQYNFVFLKLWRSLNVHSQNLMQLS